MSTEIIVKDGKCIICHNDTQIKTSYRNRETREITRVYFDLCEACKLQKNCFTCLYSKMWYLRYKGKCDVNFQLLLYATWLDDEIQEVEDIKKTIKEIIDRYSLEPQITPQMLLSEFLQLVREKLEEEVENNTSDCNIYKTKEIGKTVTDFWNHPPCKRHNRGDATAEEYWDYNSDYNNDDYSDY